MRHILQCQKLQHGRMTEFSRQTRNLQQRLQLTGKYQTLILLAVKQWLLAQPITSQYQSLTATVPDCEGKHPTHVLHKVQPVLLVQMDYHLRITVRTELMPLLLQLHAKFAVIVNLAVERDLHGTVFIAQRLRTARHVYDAQTTMPQSDRRMPRRQPGNSPRLRKPRTAGVRPAMPQTVRHSLQNVGCYPLTRIPPDRPGYATHC